MTDIQAAVGRVQLQRLPDLLGERVSLAGRYTQALRRASGLEPPHVPAYARPNYQSYAVRVTPAYPLSRDRLMQKLLEHGISTRRGIMNAHQEGAYAGSAQPPLPKSEEARDSVVLLPLYNEMNVEEQERVIACLRSISETAKAG
jgi:dTDP-4-amino-4,6-dideoxygalactose transaminase